MLIRPAAPAAQISGKQDNSIVFFTWRGIQAARSYAVPLNPQTGQQVVVRNVLSTLSKAWKTLTEAERNSFYETAQNTVLTDRLGRPFLPTAINMFIKSNTNRLYMGLPINTTGSAEVPAPLTAATATASQASSTVVITFDYPVPEDKVIKVQMETLPAETWTPNKDRSRFIHGVNASSYEIMGAPSGVQTITYAAVSLLIDTTIALWVTVVDEPTGFESQPYLLTVVVGA